MVTPCGRGCWGVPPGRQDSSSRGARLALSRCPSELSRPGRLPTCCSASTPSRRGLLPSARDALVVVNVRLTLRAMRSDSCSSALATELLCVRLRPRSWAVKRCRPPAEVSPMLLLLCAYAMVEPTSVAIDSVETLDGFPRAIAFSNPPTALVVPLRRSTACASGTACRCVPQWFASHPA